MGEILIFITIGALAGLVMGIVGMGAKLIFF